MTLSNLGSVCWSCSCPLCHPHPLPPLTATYLHRKADIQFLCLTQNTGTVPPLQSHLHPSAGHLASSSMTDNTAGKFILFSVQSSVIRNIPHDSCDWREEICLDTQASRVCTCFILSGCTPRHGRAVPTGALFLTL